MSRSNQDESSRDAVKELRRISGELNSESGRIQIQGRSLSEEEQARVAALNSAVELIKQAIDALEGS